MVKISVIVPIYNAAEYLEKCLDSIVAQTLEDIEFSDKSATRQQIERFVDENPEEVALLLRNWLNDDWD